MPAKKKKEELKSSSSSNEDSLESPRNLIVSFQLIGDYCLKECNIHMYFNGHHVLNRKWIHDEIDSVDLPIDLNDPYADFVAADNPIIFVTRPTLDRGSKHPDPLLHPDNHGGASIDLLPLILGEHEVSASLNLLSITSGLYVGCKINVNIKRNGPAESRIETGLRVPLLVTLISAHCLPPVKEGSAYIAAVGLGDLLDIPALNFDSSYSKSDASKLVWASACSGRYVANTAMNVPTNDTFVPNDLEITVTKECNSVHWNAVRRALVDPLLLKERMSDPFFIDVAAVPMTGKLEIRGRYMGFIDAKVLLESGIFGVSICVKLKYFNENDIPMGYQPLLNLPPQSAKQSARDIELVDQFGHSPYLIIRFDLFDNIIHKTKISTLFQSIGFPIPDEVGIVAAPNFELFTDPQPEDPNIDIRRIGKESGALSVHKELSSYSCQSLVPMNQSIKRTAANRLLMRVRTMLKQFSPGDVSKIDWQNIVSRHHAASRKAVTASFAPQPPLPKLSERNAASTSHRAGDEQTAKSYIEKNVFAAQGQPWPLLSQAIRLLEERRDSEASEYVSQALTCQKSNRILLWLYGAMNFIGTPDIVKSASAAFRIAVKGSYSDGTTNTIGWAALHTLHHFNSNPYAAFVAVTKMRKAFVLPIEWRAFIRRWKDTSGEQEMFWMPEVVSPHNPLLIAAAFFLCLRCYSFFDKLLLCYKNGCATKGAHTPLQNDLCHDVFYLRAASYLLRGLADEALIITNKGIRILGPCAKMSQMKTTCLSYIKGWEGDCENSFVESEKAGSEPNAFLLLRAAKASLKSDPAAALQRAARAHKITRCAYSALLIARVYMKQDERRSAESWAAAAVKMEPLLADGWAVLAILAMYERDVEKAKTMMRTSRQVGLLSADVADEVKSTMHSIKMGDSVETLVKDLCLCKSDMTY